MTTDAPTEEAQEANPRKRSGPWRKVLSVASLVLLAYLGRRYWGDLPKLLEVSPRYVAAILAISFVNRIFASEIFRQTLLAIGTRLGRMEAFNLLMLRAYSGLFIPRSGFGVTGVYLKKRYGVRFASYTGLLFPIALVQCFVIGMLGMTGLALLWRLEGIAPPWEILTVFVCCVIGAAIALLVRVKVPDSWPGKLAHFFRGLSESWHVLSRNRNLLLRLVGLQLTSILARVMRLQVAFWGIDVETHFTGVMVASLLADLAFFFSFTPGNLGFREAAIVYGASVTGATKAEALAAALLDRLVMIVSLVIIAQFSLWKMPGLRRVQELSDESSAQEYEENVSS